MTDQNERHQKKMQRLKSAVDEAIASANQEKGVVIFLTGDGKGKSSSAFGMVMRALGYGLKPAVVQFIKGQQLSGEEHYLRNFHPELPFYQMGTGFTWDTQDREKDIAAAQKTWEFALQCLQDPALDVVVLDEITYMLSFKYLPVDEIITAVRNRPEHQSVVITGRGGGSQLSEISDTVSEVKNVKHAFDAGVAARKGVDF